MALYLVQHGKSLPKKINPECPLTEEGRLTVERIARLAADNKIDVCLIRHSGKTRARETAEILEALLKPDKGVQESPGLNPLDDVVEAAKDISAEENMMLVGHLPFMERLTSYLITGSLEKAVVKFQNGGIVCLDRTQDTGSWFIKWTLMPQID